MLRRARAGRAEFAGTETGAAMAEYMPLLAVIALLVIFAITFIGPWVSERLLDAAAPLGDCPAPFSLTYPGDPPPAAHGIDRDLNGDGYLCVQMIPAGGNGHGNTGVTYNVKDNSRGP